MESIVHADIFFFIASIAVAVSIIFFVIIGFYLVKIMRNFSHISETLKEGVDTAGDELREMSEHVRESPIFSFIFGRKKTKKHIKKS